MPINGFLHEYEHQELIFYVNGKRIVDPIVDPRTTLAVYLRDHLRLTGTKIGCNEGGCGACAIMISDIDTNTDQIRHYSANACLTPVCSVFGKAVTTVEGLGSVVQKKLHPIQERLSIAHGSQCGFCTPGFVMAMYALLRNNPRPSEEEVDEALQGNLCRCTGYRPILEAYYSFSETGTAKISEGCGMGENCCKKNGKDCSKKEFNKLTTFENCQDYDPSQELIFPPELKLLKLHQQSFLIKNEGHSWFQPRSLEELLDLKQKFPHARLISGNSELAVELKFRFIDVTMMINPKQVPEMRTYEVRKEGIYLGMGLSLTEIKQILNTTTKSHSEETTAIFRSICAMLHYFAGKHVRNMASVAGNIATASPISDLNPIWMASGAKVHLVSAMNGERTVTIDENFFVGYRRTVIQPEEILIGITVPFSKEGQFFRAYKQAQRREDDIAIVTSAFSAQVDPATNEILDLKIAFGGMAPTTKLALDSVSGTQGRKWSKELFEEVTDKILKEFKLPPGVPGGMSRYRQALTISFWFKFFVHVGSELKIMDFENYKVDQPVGEPRLEHFTSTQIFYDVPEDQAPHDPVGRPVMHASGEKHVTGEAIYSADIQLLDMLYVAYVMSPVASGTIEYVDVTAAMELPGVVAYIDHKDVPGNNVISHWNSVLFAKEEVSYHGQPIGAIIAKDHETARRGAFLTKVNISPKKPIVTIEDAIRENAFHNPEGYHVRSSLLENSTAIETDWSKYSRVVEGSIRMGGQEHFYLETQNCIAIPGEDQEMEVISSTQCVNDIQKEVAAALGVPYHKVTVKVRRIGGGFGGKESIGGLFAGTAAIAAFKLRKPVKFVVERYDDMAISGTRHPFLFNYKIALGENDELLDMKIDCYSNCGHLIELSKGVMERALTHIDNVYRFKNADLHGYLCKTNCASNTAFRGFGGPQGMFCTESMMKHVSEELNIDFDKFREKNFYNEGDCTPFGMHLWQCNVKRCWKECIELSNYYKRKEEIEKLNASSRYKKRGICITPTKFGIGFGFKQLNQAGALLHVYTDGTVLLSHGGMEMGQGLHTKMLQVASRCLDIPIEMIHIHDSATDKVPNASPTAASVGSDMNGLAVKDACEKILERLEPFKKKNPEGKWVDWVNAAYENRVSLSSTGFGIIHVEPVDFMNGKGAELYGYCVYGTCVAEVEVDCLSGDHHVLQVDIVMDIGDSMNPAVDIGQIEGAFVQGYGLFTMEELRVRPDGIRLTRGPGNYKIPSADDVPRHFYVKLLKGSSNKRAIFSSKAVGEPPLFLGSTIFFAIREAVRAYRKDHGHTGYFRMDSPATPERIRMLCEDSITDRIPKLPDPSSFTPWVVDL
ncbi:hypothetical protein FO519_005802 [Halicephalobus sp. NKZ332]|nr:hypothetical protein FO519_005802 [Halicephalobus sp. NKZ332]